MSEKIEFVRLSAANARGRNARQRLPPLAARARTLPDGQPHDDDVALGAGYSSNCPTMECPGPHTDRDRRLDGLLLADERQAIADIRRAETVRAFKLLGVAEENITWLGFPGRPRFTISSAVSRPRHTANSGIMGFTGLQNAFTYHLRHIRPTSVFCPQTTDWHPTHRVVYDEFMISSFTLRAAIWPELGEPLERISYISEMAVYCDFSTPPTLRIRTPLSIWSASLPPSPPLRPRNRLGPWLKTFARPVPSSSSAPSSIKFYDPASTSTSSNQSDRPERHRTASATGCGPARQPAAAGYL